MLLNRWIGLTSGTLLALALLWMVCTVTIRMLHIPGPTVLLGLGLELTPPSASGGYFDARTISASPSVRPLMHRPLMPEILVPWRKGTTLPLNAFLTATHTNAMVVLYDNSIVYEKYFNGYKVDSQFPSYSVSKAILATLVGIAIQEGRFPSANVDIRPMLPEGVRNRYPYPIRLWDLLNMRAGIAVPETYDSVSSKVVEMYISTDLDQFIHDIPASSVPPGTRFEYRSAEYLLLGSVLRQATRQSLSAYLQTTLWQPMGAANDATWSLDSAKSGIEKSFCCINARARDYARFGLLYLDGGVRNGHRILPASWIEHTKTPTGTRDALGYSYGWWIPRDNRDGDFAAIGIYGQYIYVNPARHTVIVKLSDHGAEEDETLTLQAFQKIARQLQNQYR